MQGDHVPEHVGPPVACCCIKLADVPEMEYYAANNQGEVCVKGTNVFMGYFKDPEKTAEVIDELGWHHTGDIGMWQPVSNYTLHTIIMSRIFILMIKIIQLMDRTDQSSFFFIDFYNE